MRDYLREVGNGEIVLLTESGRLIAELRRSGNATPVLNMGLPHDPRAYRSSPLRRAVRTSDLLMPTVANDRPPIR